MAGKAAGMPPEMIESSRKERKKAEELRGARAARDEEKIDVVIEVKLDVERKFLRITKRPLTFRKGKLAEIGDLKHSTKDISDLFK